MRSLASPPARLLAALVLGATAVACSGPVDEDGGDESIEHLRRGAVTRARPEVGQLFVVSACTATLIEPNVVITAAHCVNFGNDAVGGPSKGRFVIDDGKTAYRYRVDGFKSFGNAVGKADLALVHLKDPVPADVAIPAPLARERPEPGTTVEIYGYGNESCSFTNVQRSDNGKFGTKRVFRYAFGPNPRAICGGDSGGPLFVDGQLFAVNSATTLPAGDDVSAFVQEPYVTLQNQIRQWAGEPLLDEPLDGDDEPLEPVDLGEADPPNASAAGAEESDARIGRAIACSTHLPGSSPAPLAGMGLLVGLSLLARRRSRRP